MNHAGRMAVKNYLEIEAVLLSEAEVTCLIELRIRTTLVTRLISNQW
jgi:hypothetical protein